MPVLIGVLVIAVPFVSNRGERHPARRPVAVFLVGAMLVSLVVLTVEGSAARWSPDIQAAQNAPIPPALLQRATAQNFGDGAQLSLQDKGCNTCHSLAGTGGQKGPDLTQVGSRLTREQLITRILNGGNNMPAFGDNTTSSCNS